MLAVARGIMAFALLGIAASPAWATTLVLKTGGRVTGEITNPQERPRKSYQIRTPAGAAITVAVDQVRDVLDPKNVLPRYEELLPKMPPDAAGNWKMAEWCGKQELTEERLHHLRKVIELAPDHAEARAALGYKKVGDAWENPDDKFVKNGYLKIGNKFMTRQQFELHEEAARNKEARDRLADEIKSLHAKASRGKDQEQALTKIKALNDPLALEILVADYLTTRPGNVQRNNAPGPELKKVYIGVVAKRLTPYSVRILVQIALHDPVEGVREYTAQQLIAAKHPFTTSVLLSEMGKGIEKGEQGIVNQAALLIGRLGAEDAIFPLIAALQMKVRTEQGSSGGMNLSPTFGDGGGGLGVGGGKKIIEYTLENQGVLEALRAITKVNFDYNQSAWKNWYVEIKTPKGVALRRDE